MGQNSIISSLFLPVGQKKPRPKAEVLLQELEVGPHSGPYLLVSVIRAFMTVTAYILVHFLLTIFKLIHATTIFYLIIIIIY